MCFLSYNFLYNWTKFILEGKALQSMGKNLVIVNIGYHLCLLNVKMYVYMEYIV
jgi:hypothetical protein